MGRHGDLAYYTMDRLGSPILATDAAGLPRFRPRHDAWGRQYAGQRPDDMRLDYTGHFADGDSGLVDMGFRWYDPLARRFTTEDPIKDGNNWYAYCGGDPVNYTDSDGRRPEPAEYISNYNPTNQSRLNLLQDAQDAAIDNPDYQLGSGGPFNLAPDPDYTWCNQATFDVNDNTGVEIGGMTQPENRWNTTANEASQRAPQSGRYKEVTDSAAQLLANRGFTVTGAWQNPDGGRGHLVTVRPDFNRYDANRGPLVANVGVDNEVEYAVTAYGANRLGEVRYYYDPKQFEIQ